MEPVFREIESDDIPALFFVRTRTGQNACTLAELHGLGITPASVGERLSTSNKGWLCAVDGTVVAFCMADRSNAEIMHLAEDWLRASCRTRAWLTTDTDTNLRAYTEWMR